MKNFCIKNPIIYLFLFCLLAVFAAVDTAAGLGFLSIPKCAVGTFLGGVFGSLTGFAKFC